MSKIVIFVAMFLIGVILLISAAIMGSLRNRADYDKDGKRGFFMDYTVSERFSSLKYPSVLIPYVFGIILLFASLIYVAS